MVEISYRRHRFPPVVIQDAVWLYLRFTLSYRDVEDLLAERRLDISYETVRSWVLKFGPGRSGQPSRPGAIDRPAGDGATAMLRVIRRMDRKTAASSVDRGTSP